MSAMYPDHDQSYEYETEKAVKEDGAINRLDQELDRYDKALASLSDRLGPVLKSYGEESGADGPQPAPTSALRGRADRFAGLTARLDRIIRDIDL